MHEPVSDLKPRVIGLALGSERTPEQLADEALVRCPVADLRCVRRRIVGCTVAELSRAVP